MFGQCLACNASWTPPQIHPHPIQVSLLRYLGLIELGIRVDDTRISQLSVDGVEFILTMLYMRGVQGEVVNIGQLLDQLVSAAP